MHVIILRTSDGLPARHELHACDDGVRSAGRASTIADAILRLSGIPSVPVATRLDPPWPDVPHEDAHGDAGLLDLGEVVLTVARSLSLSTDASPALAVRLKHDGVGVEALDADGSEDALLRLAPEGLMVQDTRPGVGQSSNAERLRARADALELDTLVVGVETVEHVLTAAFGSGEWRSCGPVGSPADHMASESLFDVVLNPWRAPVSWPSIASIATDRLLRLDSGTDELAKWKLAFARDVASRHAGESVMPPWPEEAVWESLSADERLAVAAHLVQGAADATHELVPVAVEQAEAWLERDGDAAPARAAELMGAVGRAEAAVGRLGPSVTALMRASDAWRALGQEDKLSHAASELLRVSALVTVQANETAQACEQHPDTSALSKAFVLFDRARHAVLVGDWATALSQLDPQSALWPSWHGQLVSASLRWRHRALLAARREQDAAAVLAELEARDDTDQLHLARLDLALATGGDWKAPLEDLFASYPLGPEALRTWRMLGGRDEMAEWTEAVARQLADWYRY